MRLGIDIGGTSIKVGTVLRDGTIKKIYSVPTPKTRRKFILVLQSIIDKHKVSAIGIGVPGAFKDGVLTWIPNIRYIEGMNLFKELKTSIPISIGNDADCFTLAESVYGAGKGYKTVAGITLGTGIGGGLVINRNLYAGSGAAMELGHTTYHGKELESFLGKDGLMKMASKLPVNNPKELSILAKKNADARAVWEKFGEILGKAINNLILTVDPEIVVVGGNISKAWRYFAPSMRKQINAPFPRKITKSKLSQPGVIGASLV